MSSAARAHAFFVRHTRVCLEPDAARHPRATPRKDATLRAPSLGGTGPGMHLGGDVRRRRGRAPTRFRTSAAADGQMNRGDEETAKRRKARVAVFVSGGGSNLRALHAAMEAGDVAAEVVAVVSNVPSCGGVLWANERGIPTMKYPPKKGEEACVYILTPDDLVRQLKEVYKADYVLLAGYLRLIPPELCRAYENAMTLNIHPALLPAFGGKGMHGHFVHEAVLASGARFTGPTVHFVNEEFDKGKIVAQRTVPVLPGDTADDVASRVLKEEHKVFAHVVSALVDGRIEFRDDGVPIIVNEDGSRE